VLSKGKREFYSLINMSVGYHSFFFSSFFLAGFFFSLDIPLTSNGFYAVWGRLPLFVFLFFFLFPFFLFFYFSPTRHDSHPQRRIASQYSNKNCATENQNRKLNFFAKLMRIDYLLTKKTQFDTIE